MERSRLTYLILKYLYNGSKLSCQEFGVSKKEYAEALDFMQKRNLITGVSITNLDKDKLLVNNQNVKITMAGINYLMENTIPDLQYRIRVSVDEVVSGVELCATVDIKGQTYKYKKVFSKPLTEIDIETESFVMVAEGLRREKESKKHAV